MEARYHIYRDDEPLCYYENDEDEVGALLWFESEKEAERFILDAIKSGTVDEGFFEEPYISKTIEYCDFGYINATNLYIGEDTKLHVVEE